MIETLSTSSYLFKTKRNRKQYQDAIDKRQALLLICAITAVVTFGVIMFIVRS